MRTKRTARKSTGRSDGDPLHSRLRILETKRGQLGPSASSFLMKQGPRQGGSSGLKNQKSVPSRTLGYNGRGKQLPASDEVERPDGHMVTQQCGYYQPVRQFSSLGNTHKLQIPKASFDRLVREITRGIGDGRHHRYQMAALMALHEAAEKYLIRLFEDAYHLTQHAKRVTLFTSDIELCQRLRGW